MVLSDDLYCHLCQLAAREGHARWKIENENNNTLKTKGYHFEHNFVHSKQHLSTTLASLIVLAYLLLHTVLDWIDARFVLLRELIVCHRRLFDDIRALASYGYFPSWSALIEFMTLGLTTRRQSLPADPWV